MQINSFNKNQISFTGVTNTTEKPIRDRINIWQKAVYLWGNFLQKLINL
ncbi:MAG: hypothetical protein WCG23_03060 [bacterium]